MNKILAAAANGAAQPPRILRGTRNMKHLKTIGIAVLAVAALATAGSAQADPNLTYKEQQWIDKNGHAICEELDKDPTQSGMSSLLGSMVYYYEMGGSSGNLIMGSIAQQCPEYRHLVPALSGGSR